MPQRSSGVLKGLQPLLVQTGSAIAVLLIVWLIISLLPMLKEVAIPVEFTLAELVGAVILTIVIVLLISFAGRLDLRLGHLLPGFPQAGAMAKQIPYLIAVLLAYSAYRPLVLPYIYGSEWVYHLLFFGVFVIVLGLLCYALYNNMDQLTVLVTGSHSAPTAAEGGVCPKCGEHNQGAAQFCSFCGAAVPKLPTCGACGRVLRPGVAFCAFCGAPAEVPMSEATTPPVAAPASTALTCHACGTVLKQQAKFCPSCGSAQE